MENGEPNIDKDSRAVCTCKDNNFKRVVNNFKLFINVGHEKKLCTFGRGLGKIVPGVRTALCCNDAIENVTLRILFFVRTRHHVPTKTRRQRSPQFSLLNTLPKHSPSQRAGIIPTIADIQVEYNNSNNNTNRVLT